MPDSRRRPKTMNGGELQTATIGLAHQFGWKVAHFRPCQTSKGWRTAVSADGKGWPDLYMINPPRGVVIYREMKGPYEPLSLDQELWGSWLNEAGQDWGVWRPKDWDDIVATLTFGRGSAQ